MTEKKTNIDWKVLSVAIVSLVALEAYAISQGFNGTNLKIVVGIVAGLAGWTIPFPTKK